MINDRQQITYSIKRKRNENQAINRFVRKLVEFEIELELELELELEPELGVSQERCFHWSFPTK